MTAARPAWLTRCVVAGIVAGLGVGAAGVALADNPMGYRMESAQDAGALPQRHGALGLTVERAQQIADQGLSFDVMRVTAVRRGSPGEVAGFRVGDQIIAVDGLVFPSIAAFAAYIGSVDPGRTILIDYMPKAAGPQQAQRISVTVGAPGAASTHAGLSTGEKVAIGAGAIALFGCYEMGCFSHHPSAPAASTAVPVPN